MAQEFTIKSKNLENQVNRLLPSQGGAQAGIDLSASTMVVPVIDLTETAEGSNLRQDLQSSLSLDVTSTNIENTTTTVIATTGFFKCFASSSTISAAGSGTQTIQITDGTTTKILFDFQLFPISSGAISTVEFIVCVGSGESVTCTSGGANQPIRFVSRQIATISGALVNPSALQS